MDAVIKQKLGRRLSGNEVKALKKQGTKIVMTRMNPEWHKPDHDHPEGRSKMRWLVLGYMQAGDNTGTDAPTRLDSSVKMMVAMGTPEGSDPMQDEISTGDIRTAFLQGYDFDDSLPQQYVGLRQYPGAELDVWEYNGPLYGDEVAPVNLHETFTDYMLDEMNYELMTDVQIASVCGLEMLKYVQSQNELSLHRNRSQQRIITATGHTVAISTCKVSGRLNH